MSSHNYRMSGQFTLRELIAAIAGEEAYAEELTRLGVGLDSEDNWADFEDVEGLPSQIDGEVVPNDQDLARVIQERSAEWRLLLVATVFVETERQRVALFRKSR